MERAQSQRAAKKIHDLGKILVKEELTAKYKQVSEILKVPPEDRTDVQKQVLEFSPEIVQKCELNRKKRDQSKSREQEIQDSPEVLEDKCLQLSRAIHRSCNMVVFTGAGISTAADIPDYRGPNGVWTLKEKGISVKTKDLCEAEPTYTHMALSQLMKLRKIKHIVSQNCDGLHVRSGVDRQKLSEIHGNMFIEICTNCTNDCEYMRLFDVTERTAIRKHSTGRKCYNCNTELRDTIVHFGEKGSMSSPYLWKEARAAVEAADLILCLGTSLKVLRKYACLWCMDRPKKKRPALYIVNLQWTPKDDSAVLKIRGDCDTVMRSVMNRLGIVAPPYFRYFDPMFQISKQLRPCEYSTRTKKVLEQGDCKFDHTYAYSGLKGIHINQDEVKPLDVDASNDHEQSINHQPSCTSDECKVREDNSHKTEHVLPNDALELSSPGWYGLGYRTSKMRKRKLLK